jgi:hypothetical protein
MVEDRRLDSNSPPMAFLRQKVGGLRRLWQAASMLPFTSFKGIWGLNDVKGDHDGPYVRANSSDHAFSSPAADGLSVQTLYPQVGSDSLITPRIADEPTVATVNGVKMLAVDGSDHLWSNELFNAINGASAFTFIGAFRWNGGRHGQDQIILGSRRYINHGPFDVGLDVEGASNIQNNLRGQLTLSANGRTDLSRSVYEDPGQNTMHNAFIEPDKTYLVRVRFKAGVGASVYVNGLFYSWPNRDISGDGALSTFVNNDGYQYVTWGADMLDRGLVGHLGPLLFSDKSLSDEECEAAEASLADMYGIGYREVDYGAAQGDEFCVAVVPDLQQYAAHGGFSDYAMADSAAMDAAGLWLVDNAEALNLDLVLQVGDSVTDGQNATQWDRVLGASTGFYRRLVAGGIPFLTCVGNHDYESSEVALRTLTTWDSKMTPAQFDSLFPLGTGYYEAGTAANMWAKISLGGTTYGVISMEHNPRQGVIDWANGLTGILQPLNGLPLILVTHDLLNESANLEATTVYGYADQNNGQQVFDEFVALNNVVFTVGGHHARGSARRLLDNTNTAGGKTLAMFYDPMLFPEGDDGNIKLLFVSPSTGRVRVRTYSPARDEQRLTFHDHYDVPWPSV